MSSAAPESKKRLFDRFAALVLRHRVQSLLLAIAVAAAGAIGGRDLPIRLSIVDLLPEDKPSVQDFNAVAAEVGGVGYLGVLVGPVDTPEQHLPVIQETLAKRDDIKYSFLERESYVLRGRALYLLPRPALDELIKATSVLVMGGKSGGAIDLGIDTDEERAANEAEARATIERIRKEHLGSAAAAAPDAAKDDAAKAQLAERSRRYFLSKDGRYAMIFAKPSFDSSDLGRSGSLITTVEQQVRAALPAGVPIALWGRYVNQVHDTEQIQRDIAFASAASIGTILLVLLLGLGSARGALIALGGMLLSMGWTAGFAKVAIGQVNIITGFMLAILSGLGVEYGIHLIRRYRHERDRGKSREEAIVETYINVGRALLSAALTSAGAFFVLAFSDFRGFSELGLIAGFGVLAIYATYMLAFPALAAFIPDRERFPKAAKAIGWYAITLRWRWALPVLAAVAIFGLTRSRLEVNLESMRKLSEETQRMNDLVVELMGGKSSTPAALLGRDADEAAAVKAMLQEPQFKKRIPDAVAIRSILPADQEERARAIRPLKKAMKRLSDEELQAKLGMDPALVRMWADAPPYAVKDLPPQVSEAFGKSGGVVVAYTDDGLSRIDDIHGMAALLLKAKERFPGMKIGTDVVILSEIIDYVFNDGRFVMLLFLAGVFFVLWLDFRSLKEALMLELQLVCGIALLMALMGVADVPFTILNVAMIPAVLAAGIDMGVHVRHREMEEQLGSIASARSVAEAVQLGMLTTLLGFGSLFVTDAAMLRGIAWVSCLGQLAMYLVCMVVFPMTKDLIASFAQKKVAPPIIERDAA